MLQLDGCLAARAGNKKRRDPAETFPRDPSLRLDEVMVQPCYSYTSTSCFSKIPLEK